MITIRYNIGLRNNPLECGEVHTMLRAVHPNATSIMSVVEEGQWNDSDEDTVAAVVITRGDWGDVKDIKKSVEAIATLMSQDAIALEIEDHRRRKGWLVYRDDYDGKKVEFNRDYFIGFQ